MRKNAPGDTGQFVGQRNREHVAVLARPTRPLDRHRNWGLTIRAHFGHDLLGVVLYRVRAVAGASAAAFS
jgi:hypothetical protein